MKRLNAVHGLYNEEPVTASEICIAIRNLYNGGSPMSPFIARKVISSFQKPHCKPKTYC
ncbi:MAG: hypothetical protein R2765_06520 [Ferruginibacter sp.]